MEYAVAYTNQRQKVNAQKIVSTLNNAKMPVKAINKTPNTYYTNAIGSFTA
jgi:hypothetical protein